MPLQDTVVLEGWVTREYESFEGAVLQCIASYMVNPSKTPVQWASGEKADCGVFPLSQYRCYRICPRNRRCGSASVRVQSSLVCASMMEHRDSDRKRCKGERHISRRVVL